MEALRIACTKSLSTTLPEYANEKEVVFNFENDLF
jgi:hypothetical protein